MVVGVANGRPVFLRDVAEVRDGGEEPSQYVEFGSSQRFSSCGHDRSFQAQRRERD